MTERSQYESIKIKIWFSVFDKPDFETLFKLCKEFYVIPGFNENGSSSYAICPELAPTGKVNHYRPLKEKDL